MIQRLGQTGERLHGEKLRDIKSNHVNRYKFAIDIIKGWFGDEDINILDSACGIGYGTMMLAEAFPKSTVTGIDKFAAGIKVAKEVYKKKNNSFQVVNLPEWPFEKDEFDVIVSMETVEHIEDDVSLLENYSLSSKRLVCSVPNQDRTPHNKAVNPWHFRHYTKDQIEALLASGGYSVEYWASQYEKSPGHVREAAKGICLLMSASR